MNNDQIMSLVRSLLKLIGGALLAHGATKAAGWVNGEDAVGLILALIGFITSHVTHKDDSTTTPTAGAKVGLLAWAMLALGIFATGCASNRLEPGGAYDPVTTTIATNLSGQVITNTAVLYEPDIVFFQIDSAFDIAYSAVDGAFKFERDNRLLLWKISPDVKHSLDKARPVVLQVAREYAVARKAYQASPTPAGLSTLQLSLSKMQSVSASAQAVIADVNKTKGK